MKNKTEIIYRYNNHSYKKVYTSEKNIYEFYVDGKKVDFTEWNRIVNLYFPMRLKRENPNFLIKLIEKNRVKNILKRFKKFKRKKILDIGCEEGIITQELLGEQVNVVLLDLDLNVLKAARNNIKQELDLIVADATYLPFKPNVFDGILAAEVLEHVPVPQNMFKEIFRCIKEKGKILITVPNEILVLKIKKFLRVLRLQFLLGSLSIDLAMGHINIFTPHSLKHLLKDHTNSCRIYYIFPFFLNIFVEIN